MIKRLLPLIAVWTILLSPAQAQDAAPTRLLGDGLAGLEAVGRVNVQGSGYCTGVLVAPDLVLTAAHCLFHKRSERRVSNDRVHFVAAWRKGEYAAHRKVSRSVIAPGYDYSARQLSGAIGQDLALLRLVSPIPSDLVAPFDVGHFEPGPVAVLSYGSGRAHVPSLQDPCSHLGSTQDRTMVLSCAVAPGSSGAPVLQGQGADLRVVGVISATVPSAQGARALAAPLGQIFDTLKARLDQSPTE